MKATYTDAGTRRGMSGVNPIALLLAAAVIACGTGGERADVPLRDEVPHARGVVELSIGDVDGPEAEVFGRIGGLAADPAGRIFVAAHQASEIRVFSPEGAHLFTFGRRGAGPAEVDGPCCLAFGPNGNLWVRDNGNARYNGFEVFPDSVRAAITLPIRHSAANMWAPLTFDAGGRLVDVGMRRDPESGRAQIVRFHRDSSGAALDTIPIPEPPADRLGLFTVSRGTESGGAMFYLYQPHGPRHLHAHAPGGGWARAVSSEYRVEWHLRTGEAIVIEREGEVGPELTPGERERAEARIESEREQLGLARRDIPYDVPERKPPLSALYFDDRGRLWVELSVTAGHDRQADVYGPDGALLAHHTWPAAVQLDPPGSVQGDVALGIERDELGVESVVRLRFR